MELLQKLFHQVINMGITASYVMAAVLLMRLLFLHMPKKYSYYLWGLVGFRLVCPVSFSSVFSMFNLHIFDRARDNYSMSYVPSDIGYAKVPKVNTGLPAVDTTINANLPPAELTASVNPMQVIMSALSVLWLIGIAVLLIYSCISYARCKRQVRQAVLLEKNIYECDNLSSPFVLGILSPKIYIPFRLEKEERSYILAHEQYHIRRKDYLVKIIAFLIASVYWFHPMVWLAYYLMCRDMEMSCDEKVISDMGMDMKQAYSRSLLAFSTNSRQNPVSPLAFGESGTGKRVKNVLHFQKPGKALTAAGTLVLLVLLFVCASNGMRQSVKVTVETLDNETNYGVKTNHKYIFDTKAETYVMYVDVFEDGVYQGRKVMLDETISPENMQGEAELSLGYFKDPSKDSLYIEAGLKEAGRMDVRQEMTYNCNDMEKKENRIMHFVGTKPNPQKFDVEMDRAYTMAVAYIGYDNDADRMSVWECEQWNQADEETFQRYSGQKGTTVLVYFMVSSKPIESLTEIRDAGIFLAEPEKGESSQNEPRDITEAVQEPGLDTTFAEQWAFAFADREGEKVGAMASEETLASMEERGLLTQEDGYISVGWSSPWPMGMWVDGKGTQFKVIEGRETTENGNAEILYYAWTSDPHVWVWRELIEYEKREGAFQIVSEQLTEMNYISAGEEYYQAYPKGMISNTPMDYMINGMGESLEEAARLSSSTAYQDLFEPDTAARYLLNLLNNLDKVEITVSAEDEEQGTASVEIFFKLDGETVKLDMIRPFSREGIWIPQTR